MTGDPARPCVTQAGAVPDCGGPDGARLVDYLAVPELGYSDRARPEGRRLWGVVGEQASGVARSRAQVVVPGREHDVVSLDASGLARRTARYPPECVQDGEIAGLSGEAVVDAGDAQLRVDLPEVIDGAVPGGRFDSTGAPCGGDRGSRLGVDELA